MSDLLTTFIQNRRPYFNHLELKRATLFLEKQIKATGYLCPIDAAIEQVSYWYPGIIRKRPIEDYGIQLELNFPRWDVHASFPKCSIPTGEEKDEDWNNYDLEEDELLVNELEENDLPF